MGQQLLLVHWMPSASGHWFMYCVKKRNCMNACVHMHVRALKQLLHNTHEAAAEHPLSVAKAVVSLNLSVTGHSPIRTDHATCQQQTPPCLT
jgi:hypothetical protein